jgi:hypothetical protein
MGLLRFNCQRTWFCSLLKKGKSQIKNSIGLPLLRVFAHPGSLESGLPTITDSQDFMPNLSFVKSCLTGS